VSQRRVPSMRGHGKIGSKRATPCITPGRSLYLRGYDKAQHQERTNAGTASHIPTEDKSTHAKPLRRHIHDIAFVRGGGRLRLSAGGNARCKPSNQDLTQQKSLSAELAREWREFDSACAAKVCSPFRLPNPHPTRRNISTGAGRETGAVVFVRRSPLSVRSLSGLSSLSSPNQRFSPVSSRFYLPLPGRL
jgi:hypothetical protein